MSVEFKVPIKNIYYMLCYAWNVTDYSDETVCGIDERRKSECLDAPILKRFW